MSKSSSSALMVGRRRAVDDPTLPVILEFQWPSTAIANAPIPRSARGITWTISSMLVAMIAVMGFIPVDQVITVHGIVVSKAPNILVQPLDTAIVRSIDVREGQQVRAGQVLARLDPTFAAADLSTLEAQARSLEAELARLQAEAQGVPFEYTGLDVDMSMQEAIYGHRKAEFNAKIEGYAQRLDEISAMISRAQSDADGYQKRLDVAQSVENMRSALEANQVGSRLSTLVATDSRAEMARSLANAQQTAEAARRNQASVVAERDAYVQGWHAEVSQLLSQATQKLSDLHEQLNKAKRRRELIELHAESDATVQSVAKVSVGSVLQSGQQFITLVPADAPLEVEANIFGHDDGYVHIGDPVAIKFDTFPYSQYGMAEGSVRIISPDSFTTQQEVRNPTSAVPLPTTTDPFYRGRITLDRVALHGVPADFRVIPGMPVTADIKVGKRTVLSYLFSRVLPVAKEGMREP
jgi:hemolysin D